MTARNSVNESFITTLLAALVILDCSLAGWGYVAGEQWFHLFHGSEYVDPQAYLPRAAGNWVMFALLQFVALLRWKIYPVWLAMIAAVRWSDSLTDLSCLFFSQNITALGVAAFTMAGVGNGLVGIYLFRSYRTIYTKA